MLVLTPWNFSNYIQLNAFHPLYSAVGSLKDSRFRLVAASPLRVGGASSGFPPASVHAKFHCSDPEVSEAWKYVARERNLDEFDWQRSAPVDIEFHHTSPMTQASRPFVFHCESFLPLFLPFLAQGQRPDKAVAAAIKPYFTHILEHDNCLGIYSHVPKTIEHLSDFFSSARIDSKLSLSPVGVDFEEGVARNDRFCSDRITFLFINSAHQSPNSFIIRGGVVALRSGLELLRRFDHLRFVFRTARPDDALLATHGVDLDFLRSQEGRGVVWLTAYLPSSMMGKLMQESDFLLLPSANLHSASILSAMAAGVIPIVSDTIGTDVYVRDGVNGVVISGPSSIWKRCPDSGIVFDDHRAFPELANQMVVDLVSRIGSLLVMPSRMKDLSTEAVASYRLRHRGDIFRNWLRVVLEQAEARLKQGEMRPVAQSMSEFDIMDIDADTFKGPTQPVLKSNYGRVQVYQIGSRFFSVPASRLIETRSLRFWSPLNKRVITDFGGAHSVGVVASSSLESSTLAARSLYFSEERSALLGMASAVQSGVGMRIALASFFGPKLKSSALVYSVARRIWRQVAWVLR